MKKFKVGFTLAEVLITLSIIGIISAIVMPSVISSYQYKTIGVKLSKFLASSEQAARAFVVSNDSFKNSDLTSVLDFINDSYIFSELNVAEQDQKTYLGASSLTDAQKKQVYAFAKPETMPTLSSYITKMNEEFDFGTNDLDENGDRENLGESCAILKDGTMVSFGLVKSEAYTNHPEAVDQSKVGLPVLNITFVPNINGLPSSVQKRFNFVVTELGYVVPNDSDVCLWNIYEKDWVTNSKLFAEGASCNTTSKTE